MISWIVFSTEVPI